MIMFSFENSIEDLRYTPLKSDAKLEITVERSTVADSIIIRKFNLSIGF
jgi:hypothetical protein